MLHRLRAKAHRPSDLGRGTFRSLEHHYVDGIVGRPPAFQIFRQPLARQFAFRNEIASHTGGIEALVGYIHSPVHQNHRNACLLRLLKYSLPAGLNHWCKHDIIHALRNKAADGLDLILLLLPCIVKNQKIAVLFGQCSLNRFGIGCPPSGLTSKLGHTHHDPVRLLSVIWCLLYICKKSQAAPAGHCKNEHSSQQYDHDSVNIRL